MIDALPDGDFARARTACAIFSAAALGALDGVYYTDRLRPAPTYRIDRTNAPSRRDSSDELVRLTPEMSLQVRIRLAPRRCIG